MLNISTKFWLKCQILHSDCTKAERGEQNHPFLFIFLRLIFIIYFKNDIKNRRAYIFQSDSL